MPRNNWCVYIHENRINGKKYIGITGRQPEQRWKRGRGYANNQHFTRAVEKYGWEGFTHVIFQSGLTKANAEQLEIELIAKYQTQDPSKGYNLREGGHAASCAPESRAKMSAAARKRSVSTAAREASRRYWLQHKHNPQSIEKMRTAQKGRTATKETRARQSAAAHKKAVICFETGEVYSSLLDAQRQTGIDRSVISRCCSNKAHSKSAGGYHWGFVESKYTGKEE